MEGSHNHPQAAHDLTRWWLACGATMVVAKMLLPPPPRSAVRANTRRSGVSIAPDAMKMHLLENRVESDHDRALREAAERADEEREEAERQAAEREAAEQLALEAERQARRSKEQEELQQAAEDEARRAKAADDRAARDRAIKKAPEPPQEPPKIGFGSAQPQRPPTLQPGFEWSTSSSTDFVALSMGLQLYAPMKLNVAVPGRVELELERARGLGKTRSRVVTRRVVRADLGGGSSLECGWQPPSQDATRPLITETRLERTRQLRRFQSASILRRAAREEGYIANSPPSPPPIKAVELPVAGCMESTFTTPPRRKPSISRPQSSPAIRSPAFTAPALSLYLPDSGTPPPWSKSRPHTAAADRVRARHGTDRMQNRAVAGTVSHAVSLAVGLGGAGGCGYSISSAAGIREAALDPEYYRLDGSHRGGARGPAGPGVASICLPSPMPHPVQSQSQRQSQQPRSY